MTATAMARSAFAQNWLGVLALGLAAIAVCDFIAFMSISGQIPKSLAFQPDLPFEVYIDSPLISSFAGVLSVVIAIFALVRAAAPVWPPVVGAIVGIALFNAIMVAVAQVMLSSSLSQSDGKDLAVPSFPSFAFTPPAIAMEALGIGVAVVLARTRLTSGQRPAIAALVTGGAVVFYWLFNLVWSLNAD